jgi:hypothetical protein
MKKQSQEGGQERAPAQLWAPQVPRFIHGQVCLSNNAILFKSLPDLIRIEDHFIKSFRNKIKKVDCFKTSSQDRLAP